MGYSPGADVVLESKAWRSEIEQDENLDLGGLRDGMAGVLKRGQKPGQEGAL